MKTYLPLLLLGLLLLFSAAACVPQNCDHPNLTQEVIAPTCDREGYTLNHCADCRLTFTTALVTPTGHHLQTRVTAPTCTEQGYTDFTCPCGYAFRSEYTAPTGHSFTSETVQPTCTEAGYTQLRCTICAEEQTKDIVAPMGHDYATDTHAATCTEEGYTDYDCRVCDFAYRGDLVPALGHSFEKTVTLPTSSRAGSTLYTCHCSYSYTGDHIFSADRFHGAYVDATEHIAHGIDVSKWNGTLDFAKTKASGVDFVIIKIGSTGFGVDPNFEENYKAAKAAGLQVGGYFYTYAMTLSESLQDAYTTMDYIKGKQFEYPIYLDIEDASQRELGKTLLTDMCVAYLECLQENGYFSALYTNYDWLFNILDTQRITTLFDVWLARWKLDGQPIWGSSFTHPRTGLWQYTDSGSLEGHDCAFDMNVAFKDYPTLIKQWGYNGYTASKAV